MGLDRISSYQLVDYIYDMPTVMAAADLVISRAGAMTLSELAGMGKAAILIPSPNVTSNHQYHNAKALSDVGAAVLVCEDALSSGGLDESVEQLLGDPAARMQLSEKIEQFACRDANRMIWQDILELTKPR